jgi:protein-tyrosine phosphatase
MTATILFLCTANRCRSPLAAALLEQSLAAQGTTAKVLSAGLLRSGDPVPADGISVAQEFGLDLTGHLSRRMTGDIIDSADLVLGMAREHAREAVAAVPARWPRTFTLLQFVRWLESVDLPRRAALGDWLDGVAGDRPRTSLIGADPKDDIDDPMARPLRVWRETATLLRAKTRTVAERLAPILG